MKITDIRATTVAVPLKAPLRHANGAHWGKFVRTIVEVETDEGLVGLGEMGGGGESAEAAFQGLKPYLVGHDPFELEALRFKICNPMYPPATIDTQVLTCDPTGGFATKIVYGLSNFLRLNPAFEALMI